MDEELKEAYERLGLPEDVTKEEVNRRFDLLLKRRRSVSRGVNEGEDASATAAYEEELSAYRTILNVWARRETEQAENERLAKWGRFGGTARRLEHFFRLYKTHVLIAAVVLIALVAVTVAVQNHLQERRYLASLPPVDLNVTFIGAYSAENDSKEDGEPLEQAILKAFPDWRRVEVKLLYLPPANGEGGMADMAYVQKAIAELSVSKPDVLVMDKDSFPWLAQQGGLVDLEASSLAEWFASGAEDGHIRRAVSTEDGTEHAYGIDFTDSRLASSLPLKYTALIGGVSSGAVNQETALQFIRLCAEQAGTK